MPALEMSQISKHRTGLYTQEYFVRNHQVRYSYPDYEIYTSFDFPP